MARLALNLDNSRAKSDKIGIGGMGEWLKPAVLKTVSGVTRSGVRIPLPPPRYERPLLGPARGFRMLHPFGSCQPTEPCSS
jgi:hypothetical protein